MAKAGTVVDSLGNDTFTKSLVFKPYGKETTNHKISNCTKRDEGEQMPQSEPFPQLPPAPEVYGIINNTCIFHDIGNMFSLIRHISYLHSILRT